jgi:hypothetical protein
VNRSHGNRLPRRDSHFCRILGTVSAYQLTRRELPDMIAVGTGIAPRPPHGSGQAQLRDPVLTSSI